MWLGKYNIVVDFIKIVFTTKFMKQYRFIVNMTNLHVCKIIAHEKYFSRKHCDQYKYVITTIWLSLLPISL